MNNRFNKNVTSKQLKTLIEDYNLTMDIHGYHKMTKPQLQNAILKHMITNDDGKQQTFQSVEQSYAGAIPIETSVHYSKLVPKNIDAHYAHIENHDNLLAKNKEALKSHIEELRDELKSTDDKKLKAEIKKEMADVRKHHKSNATKIKKSKREGLTKLRKGGNLMAVAEMALPFITDAIGNFIGEQKEASRRKGIRTNYMLDRMKSGQYAKDIEEMGRTGKVPIGMHYDGDYSGSGLRRKRKGGDFASTALDLGQKALPLITDAIGDYIGQRKEESRRKGIRTNYLLDRMKSGQYAKDIEEMGRTGKVPIGMNYDGDYSGSGLRRKRKH